MWFQLIVEDTHVALPGSLLFQVLRFAGQSGASPGRGQDNQDCWRRVAGEMEGTRGCSNPKGVWKDVTPVFPLCVSRLDLWSTLKEAGWDKG